MNSRLELMSRKNFRKLNLFQKFIFKSSVIAEVSINEKVQPILKLKLCSAKTILQLVKRACGTEVVVAS